MRFVGTQHLLVAALVGLAACGGGSGGDDGASGGGTVATPVVPLSNVQATEAASGAGLTLISALVAIAADPPGLGLTANAMAQQTRGADAAARTVACANGGEIEATCRVSDGRSIVSSRADECLIATTANGFEVVASGRLRASIDAADVCATGEIPPGAVRSYRFTDFQAVVRAAGDVVETFSAPQLSQDVHPLADGCAGSQARLVMRGRLAVRRNDGIDVRVDADALQLTVQSDGVPCAQRIVANGRMDVEDTGGGRALRAALDGLTVTNIVGDFGYSLAGGAVLDCIGALAFSSAEPVVLDAPCASQGYLRFTLPSGANAASRFDDHGLGLDVDGDDVFERVVASCTDPQLASCR